MFLKNIVLFTCILQSFCEVPRRIITSLKYSNYHVKLTVVNGWPAEHWQVPFLVSIKEPLLKRDNLTYWSNLCGASVIAENGKLLTAAHCFEANRFFFSKRPYLLRAVAGSSKTDIISKGDSGNYNNGVQWRRIKHVILHPLFTFPYNDIAVAFVDFAWDTKRGVKPIALPSGDTDRLGDCYTAGFGRTGHGPADKTSDILLLAKIDTLPKGLCAMVWNMHMDEFICTTSGRSDVSEGDSGGPLACAQAPGWGTAHSLDGAVLVGVVSGKNYDKTTLYTRVSAYTPWLRSNFTSYNSSRRHKDLLGFYAILLSLVYVVTIG